MDKLQEYLSQNIKFSDYIKDYDEEECVEFWYANAQVIFNGKEYFVKYISTNHSDYFRDHLYSKLLNKIITSLGLEKLNEIFKKIT